VIVKDLGARTARSGVAHHPEIVRGIARALVVADADHTLGRHSNFPGPDVVCLVVFGIHRHPQFVLWQFINKGQQFPRKLDRIPLEVIAKAEVAQHLEESMVARGITDVLQIVVFAAGTHAFLRRGRTGIGTLVEAEEHILELIHARVGEQQRRIFVRHQRTGRYDGMSLGCEIIKEFLADFTAFHCMP
jgi:hypothetical protein